MPRWLEAALACAAPDPDRPAPGSTTGTTIPLPTTPSTAPQCTVEPTPAPLAARLVCPDATPFDVRWDDGRTERHYGGPDGTHRILAGMDPSSLVRIVVSNGHHEQVMTFLSGELPAGFFPDVEVLSDDPARRAEGWTLLAPRLATGGALLMAFDESWMPVWVFETALAVNDIEADGTGIVGVGGHSVASWNWAGDATGRWHPRPSPDPEAIEVPVDGLVFHHEVGFWHGDIYALSQTTTEAENFPLSYDDPAVSGPATLAADQLVRFSRDGLDASVLVDFPSVLDAQRIGYDSLANNEGALDWTHANAASRLPTDDGWLLSARHQDAVFAVDDAGEVSWILAPSANWGELHAGKLLASDDPPYHAHSPSFSPDGSLLVFDNHVVLASPWTGEIPIHNDDSVARAIAFDLDLTARTATSTIRFDASTLGPFASPIVGDVDALPNGNWLALFGAVTHVGGEPVEALGFEGRLIRLVEVDPLTGDVVSDVQLSSLLGASPGGWLSYRAHRFPGSFPPY